jgi:hypothetical protein
MTEEIGIGAAGGREAGAVDSTRGRLIFVVARSDPERYDYLKRTFREEAKVDVVLDRRRRGERRWHDATPSLDERRRTDRRRVDTGESLRSLGWALIRKPF